MDSVPQMFKTALQYHQAGNLQQAETLYRQILQLDPRALRCAAHARRDGSSVRPQRSGGRLHPAGSAPSSGVSRGATTIWAALVAQGKLTEALASFRQAIAIKPDFADALQQPGKRSERVRESSRKRSPATGRPCAEARLCRRVQQPGQCPERSGKLEEAITAYRQALRLRPNFAQTYNNLGNALKDQGKLDEAIANYQQALRLQPGSQSASLQPRRRAAAVGRLHRGGASVSGGAARQSEARRGLVAVGEAAGRQAARGRPRPPRTASGRTGPERRRPRQTTLRPGRGVRRQERVRTGRRPAATGQRPDAGPAPPERPGLQTRRTMPVSSRISWRPSPRRSSSGCAASAWRRSGRCSSSACRVRARP